MTYSTHSVVRPIAGRLVLDFLNTANWSADGVVLEEKIESMADLHAWIRALDMPQAICPTSVEGIYAFRSQLRSMFLDERRAEDTLLRQHLLTLQIGGSSADQPFLRQPILGLIAISALSVVTDARELARVKKCPGVGCGWVFIDETKNARRKWCIMETCGNRAKAARNYARKTRS